MKSQAMKFPYVTEYSLFETVDVRVAEELLAEYNDFYIYNESQYYEIFKRAKAEVYENADSEINLALAEKNAKETTDFFRNMFGSKDFAKSSLVGLRISWYDLQQILLAEFKNKTPIEESAVVHTAYMLRNLASFLLFAEEIVYGMTRMKNSDEEAIELVKQRFVKALENVENLSIPEFHKEKKSLTKLKTMEQYLEFTKKILGG